MNEKLKTLKNQIQEMSAEFQAKENELKSCNERRSDLRVEEGNGWASQFLLGRRKC